MNFADVRAITIPEGDVKSIAIGGVTVWQKPSPLPYDAEVDYIQTDGEAYVDTGVLLASGAEITAIFSNLLVAKGSLLFGARTAYNVKGFSAQWGANGNIYFNFGNRQDSAPASYDNSPQMLTVRNNVLSIGSYSVTSPTTSAFTTAFPAYVLCMNNGGSPTARYAGLRCHGFRIEQGVLVRDFIPVRVGTAGYLYDRANPTGGPLGNGLYGSATSTPLVAGPDKIGGGA